jgi:hypothetical protein
MNTSESLIILKVTSEMIKKHQFVGNSAINKIDRAIEQLEEAAKTQVEQRSAEHHQEFDQYLNEIFEPVTIAGLHFTPSEIVYECDPIGYRCLADDFEDAMTRSD